MIHAFVVVLALNGGFEVSVAEFPSTEFYQLGNSANANLPAAAKPLLQTASHKKRKKRKPVCATQSHKWQTAGATSPYCI